MLVSCQISFSGQHCCLHPRDVLTPTSYCCSLTEVNITADAFPRVWSLFHAVVLLSSRILEVLIILSTLIDLPRTVILPLCNGSESCLTPLLLQIGFFLLLLIELVHSILLSLFSLLHQSLFLSIILVVTIGNLHNWLICWLSPVFYWLFSLTDEGRCICTSHHGT